MGLKGETGRQFGGLGKGGSNSPALIADPERELIPYSHERLEERVRSGNSAQMGDPGAAPRFANQTLRDYLTIFKRYKTLALTVFGAVFTAVALYAFLATPTYRF